MLDILYMYWTRVTTQVVGYNTGEGGHNTGILSYNIGVVGYNNTSPFS